MINKISAPTSPCAIYTIMLGDLPYFPYAFKTFEHYAKKIGADLICCREPKHSNGFVSSSKNAIGPCLEKLEIGELLKPYDRVLYLDADILIFPHADSIFEVYPDPNFIYLFEEGAYQSRSLHIQASLDHFGTIDWPSHRQDYPVYYNAGVMLFSKQNKSFFDRLSKSEFDHIAHIPLFEQTYFNDLFFRYGIPVKSLAPTFNRMDLLGQYTRRNEGAFVHYSGSGFTRKASRRNGMMIADYYTFIARPLGEAVSPAKKGYHRFRRFLNGLNMPVIR